MRLQVGPFDIEAGGMKHRVGRLRIPDGLHLWAGRYGVHLFWSGSKYQRRIWFEKDDR